MMHSIAGAGTPLRKPTSDRAAVLGAGAAAKVASLMPVINAAEIPNRPRRSAVLARAGSLRAAP